jgi:hypothetical protein
LKDKTLSVIVLSALVKRVNGTPNRYLTAVVNSLKTLPWRTF